MMRFDTALPIDDVLDRLLAAVAASRSTVLVAPPGAGKTTRVPLALLPEISGKILLLEPRRLAARASAERMAKTLGESVGETVGLRVRFDARISAKTRIEVVTEGVFTRMILDDPLLEGVGCVIFDEFHERSLDADIGLAFALDAQEGLREDLKLLVMSATLDGARVASLLKDAPIIESLGRAFPVSTRYVGRDPQNRLEAEVAKVVQRALREESGSALVFLPGTAEIRRVGEMLREAITEPSVEIAQLHGSLEPKEQDRAILAVRSGRKVVLATSIAETSITIEGVRIVVDCGLARVPRYEADLGVTRLETVRVSRASADQRRGRAGRTEPGVCYRLWDEHQEGAFDAYAQPEILAADLSSLVLDGTAWGVGDVSTLRFLDPPPKPALQEAQKLLVSLGALDDNRLTALGQRLRQLPLPPRLARMVLEAEKSGEALLAAYLAVLITERGLGGPSEHLGHRLDGFLRERGQRADAARHMARGWLKTIGARTGDIHVEDAGRLIALAFPDRIAKARGQDGEFLLANGRGARVDTASPLAKEPYLAVAELTGNAARSRILSAAPLSLSDIETHFASLIALEDGVSFDAKAAALRARRIKKLGAITLSDVSLAVTADEKAAEALGRGIAALGLHRLPWSKAQQTLRHRIAFIRKVDDSYPDLSDTALSASITEWLSPFLIGKTALSAIGADDLSQALDLLVPWEMKRRLDDDLPSHFHAPSGNHHPINYEGEEPTLAIRVQELFGLARHPTIAKGRIALVVELLSPAHRPVQITRDLPGFWAGSYQSVKVEMKGRYPRHPWPDNPLEAQATHRAKPRGT